MVWTVNEPGEMVEVGARVSSSHAIGQAMLRADERAQAVRWGVDVILTDVTKTWLDLRNALHGERSRVLPITLAAVLITPSLPIFSGLRQDCGAVRPHVPLDLVEVLHPRNKARRTFFARVYRVCRRAVRPCPGCLSCCPPRVRFCMIIVVHALLLFGLSRTPHRLSNCAPIYRRIGISLISSSV